MLWLKLFTNFIDVIKSGASPTQIASGFTLGFFIGLTPGWPLHILALLLLVLIFNVNLGMALIGASLAASAAWLFDPWLDTLGASVLQASALQTLWTSLYNNGFFILTRFNNTLVMGGAVVGLILAVPLYLLSFWLMKNYRDRVLQKIKQSKLAMLIRGSKFYSLLAKARGIV